MGYYVNPPAGVSKFTWLAANGTLVKEPKSFAERPPGTLLVVLVDNNVFAAAGVAFDAREQGMMTDTTVDKRQRLYFYVPVERLIAAGALPKTFKVREV